MVSPYTFCIKVGEKSLIYTPGLGYTPIIVEERALLSPETVNMLRDALGTSDILEEIFIMGPDPEYLELLIKAGFRVGEEGERHPYASPTMEVVYGFSIPGRYIVRGAGVVASYPPLGFYNSEKSEIYVLKSVSDKLGLIAHEEVHHALNTHRYSELERFEESVARFYELCLEFSVKSPTLGELDQLLRDDAVKSRLEDLVVTVLHPLGSPKDPASKRFHPFVQALGLVEEGDIQISTLVGILTGRLCIEKYGYVFRIVKCSSN